MRACAGHPAVRAYAIGNEIPAPIARWYGQERIERFLKRLYRLAKAEDPGALVTYVNYPTTEYLRLPFLDFLCFNVYLESQDQLEAYLARLQNLADEKPLVMAEIGLDSRRNGEQTQAETLAWQISTSFAAGCAGIIVFSWTDEWHRGGHDIEDWDFGLTRRDRSPKPALEAVGNAFSHVPFPVDTDWPSVSVVLCSYNGAPTIAETLTAIENLQYPNYEVIVVSDGSNDGTETIAQGFDVHLIKTENRGLSSARNTGLEAASGEIVVYIDDDAYPDPHWLHYLAITYKSLPVAGVGGPNLSPPGDRAISHCVANAPGNPVHVLVSDREAEHIPGCNMSFLRKELRAIGGFDPQFRIAGDDVDVCWRLQERGLQLGFHPAALVWHHRRGSVHAYWKQQHNYGRAEGMLERKWPGKYNSFGHSTWTGRMYGPGLTQALMLRRYRIYHGIWGGGLFQSIYELTPGRLSTMPLMPEWYPVVAGLIGLSLLGLFWSPLLLTWPLSVVAIGLLLVQITYNGLSSTFADEPLSAPARWARYALTSFLYFLQPLARLSGRLRHGLVPWRRHGKLGFVIPVPRNCVLWSEQWLSLQSRLASLEAALRKQGAVVQKGGEFDRWDLQVRGGLFGAVRGRATVEEHGEGNQLLRFRSWPRFMPWSFGLTFLVAILAALAVADGAWVVACLLALIAAGAVASGFADCAVATESLLYALQKDRLGGGRFFEHSRVPVAPQSAEGAVQPEFGDIRQQQTEAQQRSATP